MDNPLFDIEKHRKYLYAGKKVSCAADIPKGEHWAVLLFESHRRSTGYEREGEIGDLIPHTDYRVFQSEEELRGWIEVNYIRSNYKTPMNFKIVHVKPVEMEFSVGFKLAK